MDCHLVGAEEVPEVAGVGKAHALDGDQVVLHLHDGGGLALQVQLVGDLTARQAAADDGDVLAHFGLLQQVVDGLDALFDALDRDPDGAGTGGDHHFVGTQRGDVLHFGVQLDLDGILADLTAIPCDQVTVLLLEGGGRRRDEHAAQTVGLFVEGHLVTALGADQRGLHAADAAADHGHIFGLFGGLQPILFRLHGGGVDGTAGKAHGVGQVLGVGVALEAAEVETAVMTADAGSDVLQTVLDHLRDPLAVGKELAGNAHGIDLAIFDRLRTDLRLHTAGADHGDVHELFDMGHVCQIAVLGHVHGGMGPVPAVIGAVVGVEHIVAGILQIFGGTLGLCHVTAHLGVLLAGDGAGAEALDLGLHAVTQGHGEVLTAGGLDRLDHLHREAVAVLEGAAVLIGTLVGPLHGELIQQVTLVDRMDLHAVYAGILTELGGLGEGLDDLMDLLDGHLRGGDLRVPTGGQGAGAGQLVVSIDDGLGEAAQEFVLVDRGYHVGDRPAAAHAGGELDEKLGAGLVDLVHELLQFLEHLGVLPQPAAPEGVPEGSDAGDDQAHVVFRSFKEEVGGLFVEFTAGQLEPAEQGRAAHGAQDDAVLDLYVAHLPGGEQGVVCSVHIAVSFFVMLIGQHLYYRVYLGDRQ